MNRTGQFVKRKKLNPIHKESSFDLMIENIEELLVKNHSEFVSKKIEFLDIDAVWWIAVKKSVYKRKDTFNLTIHLHTNENIWKSRIWSFTVKITFNKINFPESSAHNIVEAQSRLTKIYYSDTWKGIPFLKLNLKITMSATPEADEIPLHKYIDMAVQCKKIMSTYKCILSESKYSDFTFIVEGKEFKVHKSILAAASPVFDKLFTSKLKESRTNECHVADIESAIFEHLLKFIYSGELPENLQEEDVPRKLFSAAHYYQIDELVDVCKQVEHFKLSVENAVEIYKWAFTYDFEELKMDAWNIIKFNTLEIFGPMKPPSPDSLSSLIAVKEKKEKLLETYRVELSKLQTATKET